MQSPIKIEKGIPLPKGRSKGYTDAIKALQVDESAFIPAKLATVNGAIQRLYRSNHAPRGMYTARAEIMGSIVGTRVWRRI